MKHLLPIAVLFLLISTNTCVSKQIETNASTGGLVPIDIRAPVFFWMLRPWKDGTLATIDEQCRFAEISFEGANRMRIRHLVNYPRTQLDKMLLAYPEHDLLIAKSARMFHVANLGDNQNRSFVPKMTLDHDEQLPMIIDSDEGLLAFPYNAGRINNRNKIFFIIYNYKTDRIIGEFGNTDDDMRILYPIDKDNIITITRQNSLPLIVEFYNWRTGVRINNELTESLTRSSLTELHLLQYLNINTVKRYLFTKTGTLISPVALKVSWKDDYRNTNIVPINYLLLEEGKWLGLFFISQNGQWATTFVGGYTGLNREILHKRAFFHLDDRYPNGISMPVFTDGYRNFQYDWGSFVNHLVHGECFAEEYWENGVQYLRLYKMSEVLAEIEKQMKEQGELDV